MSERIDFYRVQDADGEFSNFAPFPITLEGISWPTSEHYFQALKFHDLEYREKIRAEVSPMIAARLGRSRDVPLRSDWEAVKDDIMLAAVRAKFTQHAALRDLLLSTGNALLVEHTTNDTYWGDGGDGNGRNRLGQLLMQVREELRGA